MIPTFVMVFLVVCVSNTVSERISLSNFEKQIEMYLTGYLEEIRLVGTGGRRGSRSYLSANWKGRLGGVVVVVEVAVNVIVVCKLEGTPGGRLRGEHHFEMLLVMLWGQSNYKGQYYSDHSYTYTSIL